MKAGEICQEWQNWGDYFHIHSIFGRSLLQASIYVVLAVSRSFRNIYFHFLMARSQVAFAGSSALLVVTYAPQ